MRNLNFANIFIKQIWLMRSAIRSPVCNGGIKRVDSDSVNEHVNHRTIEIMTPAYAKPLNVYLKRKKIEYVICILINE